ISIFQPGPPRGFAVGASVSSLELMLGAGVLFIAFQGFEVVAQLSDPVKHPESSVPRVGFLALLLAFLVCGGVFLAGLSSAPAAVALTCVGAGLLVFLTIETIAILASLAFLGLFAFVHASVIALRRGERRSAPGFRVPLVPAVPMAAIALNLALGALLWNYPARRDAPIPPGTFAMLLGGVWLAVGLAYHWIGGRRTAGRPVSA